MKLTAKIVSLLAVVVILFMVPAVILIWHNQQNTITQQARARAITLFQMIVVTRQWVAENRDRIEPVPAVATKELSKYADYMADFTFSITSDRLINPDNAPSEFEKRAITALKKGAPEYAERGYDKNMEGNVYRYAAPLLINESCLSCHSFQGYKINQFRGLISIIIPLRDLEESIQKNNITLMATVIAGITVIITIVSLLVYYLVLSPISKLTTAAGKIRGGDYHVRTEINTNDEINELSEAFDMMSAEIEKNEENLKAKLSEAVAKYISLVDELKEKNEQLGTLNQLKTDLLDSIAHEIRTPLTKIMLYTELLNDPRLQNDGEGRARFTESLKHNISSISGMFNDIITMSRLEHGQHTYHKIPINAKEFIHNILNMLEADIAAKQLQVDVQIADDDKILVDGESFYYALSNILSNSVKYSHKKGRIIIRMENRENKNILTFYDEGVGIPEEDLPEVLSRFHRSANVKNEYPGTGLGLSIVARVVREHAGTLTIESEQNRYTKVTITLPATEDAR